MALSFISPSLYWLLNLGVCQLYPFYKMFVHLYRSHFKAPKPAEVEDSSAGADSGGAVPAEKVKLVHYGHFFVYWGLYLPYSYLESVLPFLKLLPFYYELKLLFFFWLGSDHFKGAGYLFHKFLNKHLAEVSARVKKYVRETTDEKARASVLDFVRGLGAPHDFTASKAL